MNTRVRRGILGALAVGALFFAVEGGEYGTSDLLRQRARRHALEAQIAALQLQVDSLARLERRLRTDPVLQERVAREEFGMVRGERELLYRFAEPRGAAGAPSDSALAAGRAGAESVRGGG